MNSPCPFNPDQYYLPPTGLAQPWREIDTAFINANGWPKDLIDLACARGHQEYKLLRNTGIFLEDIASRKPQFSALQLFRLIENILKHPAGHELAFLLGSNLLVNHPHTTKAGNLHEWLDIIMQQSYLLSPLLSPHYHYEQDRLVIYWNDNFGADELLPFLLEIAFTGLQVSTRRHAGKQLPWSFYCSHNRPSHIEQYQVHLGERVLFNARSNAVAIARKELYCPWPTTSVSTQKIIQGQINNSSEITAAETHDSIRHTPRDLTSVPIIEPRGFLHEIYHYLKNNIHHNPNLEKTAQDFGMSNATLKRKLQKHNSSFQQQFDEVRKHLALHWLSKEGITQEEIAQHLHFYDAANLRRAFKRWTGQLPGKL